MKHGGYDGNSKCSLLNEILGNYEKNLNLELKKIYEGFNC